MKERILDINPKANVTVHRCFFLPENSDQFDFASYSYIVDAIDTVTAKIELVMKAKEFGVPIISAMGAATRLTHPAQGCGHIQDIRLPVARVMRYELRKRGIKNLKVVYSTEEPRKPVEDIAISCRTNCVCPPGTERKCTDRRNIPGSTSFVPSVAGLIIAGEVIKDIIGDING